MGEIGFGGSVEGVVVGKRNEGVLTYMSIQAIIIERCKEGLLFPIEPSIPSDSIVRGLYASKEVYERLLNYSDTSGAWGTVKATMDDFVSGRLISVGYEGRRHKSTHKMALLEPKHNGVWEIRVTKPRPAIRIFGQFAAKDLFIVLEWGERKALGEFGSKEWKTITRNCKAQWRRLFNPYNPLLEEDENDYLSNIFLS